MDAKAKFQVRPGWKFSAIKDTEVVRPREVAIPPTNRKTIDQAPVLDSPHGSRGERLQQAAGEKDFFATQAVPKRARYEESAAIGQGLHRNWSGGDDVRMIFVSIFFP